MSANPLDQDHTVLVLGLDDQSVGVALDVKNHLVVCQKAGTGVSALDVLWTRPLSALGLNSPGVKWPTCISVFAVEIVELDEAK